MTDRFYLRSFPSPIPIFHSFFQQFRRYDPAKGTCRIIAHVRIKWKHVGPSLIGLLQHRWPPRREAHAVQTNLEQRRIRFQGRPSMKQSWHGPCTASNCMCTGYSTIIIVGNNKEAYDSTVNMYICVVCRWALIISFVTSLGEGEANDDPSLFSIRHKEQGR